jgi:cytochrome c peroxidase
MFTDGLKLAVGAGIGNRHTPSLVGLSYSPWFYWDGRKDSQWAQALAPLEAKHEHAMTRSDLARLILSDADYAARYRSAFGALLVSIFQPVRRHSATTPNARSGRFARDRAAGH